MATSSASGADDNHATALATVLVGRHVLFGWFKVGRILFSNFDDEFTSSERVDLVWNEVSMKEKREGEGEGGRGRG